MSLQRRICPADAIERCYFCHDIPGRGKVAHADLIFLRVEILLTARQRRRLAEFEPGIHAPESGQRAGQRRADQETRTARGLQEWRIDVRRVDEEVRSEEV